MITKLNHVTVLVRDQDEALRFYTEKLGFEKRADVAFGPGARWLTVAPRGQTEIEIVLQRPDPAMHGEEDARQMLEMVGRGTTWVFTCDDCRATHAALRERGVEFQSEPQAQPYGVEAVFVDLYGNSFSLLEPRPMELPMETPVEQREAAESDKGTDAATPTDWAAKRAELLGVQRAGATAMETAIAALDEARMIQAGATGHWSAKNVLAHIASSNDWLSEQVERATRGDAPPSADEIQKMQDDGFFDNEFVNTYTYNQNKDRTSADVLDWWRRSTARLASAITAAPESVLAAPDWWTSERPVGQSIWVTHEGEHAHELSAWAAQPR